MSSNNLIFGIARKKREGAGALWKLGISPENMLFIGKDHLTAAGQEWRTVKGCFEYTAYFFNSETSSNPNYVDAIVGPIGAGNDELYFYERIWDD